MANYVWEMQHAIISLLEIHSRGHGAEARIPVVSHAKELC